MTHTDNICPLQHHIDISAEASHYVQLTICKKSMQFHLC